MTSRIINIHIVKCLQQKSNLARFAAEKWVSLLQAYWKVLDLLQHSDTCAEHRKRAS
jgi:hypothetical protein